MPGQPTEREMALLYLLYRVKDYIDDCHIFTSNAKDYAEVLAVLAAVGDEKFWWDYHCEQYRKAHHADEEDR